MSSTNQEILPRIRTATIRVDPSEQQISIVSGLHTLMGDFLGMLTLTEEHRLEGITVHPKILALCEKLCAKIQEGWMVDYHPKPHEEAEKVSRAHCIKDLLPFPWRSIFERGRAGRKFKASAKIPVSDTLTRFARRYVDSELPLAGPEFDEEKRVYGGEIALLAQRLIESASVTAKRLKDPHQPLGDKERRELVLQSCRQVESASVFVHRICELVDDTSRVRESASLLLEYYRYADDVLTDGLEPAGVSYVKHRESYREAPPERDFLKQLYSPFASRAASAEQLLGLAVREEGGVLRAAIPEVPSDDFLTPKNAALLRYLRRRLRAEPSPAVVVVADTEEHAQYVFNLLRSRQIASRAGILLASADTKINRENALRLLEQNEVGFIVTTKLESISPGVLLRSTIICNLSQERRPLAQYDWVAALRKAGVSPLVVNFWTKGSSDEARRAYVKRARRGGDFVSDGFSGSDAVRLLQYEFESSLRSSFNLRGGSLRSLLRFYSKAQDLFSTLHGPSPVQPRVLEEYRSGQTSHLRGLRESLMQRGVGGALKAALVVVMNRLFDDAALFLHVGVVEELGLESALRRWGSGVDALLKAVSYEKDAPPGARVLNYCVLLGFAQHREDIRFLMTNGYEKAPFPEGYEKLEKFLLNRTTRALEWLELVIAELEGDTEKSPRARASHLRVYRSLLDRLRGFEPTAEERV